MVEDYGLPAGDAAVPVDEGRIGPVLDGCRRQRSRRMRGAPHSRGLRRRSDGRGRGRPAESHQGGGVGPSRRRSGEGAAALAWEEFESVVTLAAACQQEAAVFQPWELAFTVFTVADIIKEELWPNPMMYFDNEAEEEFEEDEDEERSDEDDDEEDEEGEEDDGE